MYDTTWHEIDINSPLFISYPEPVENDKVFEHQIITNIQIELSE